MAKIKDTMKTQINDEVDLSMMMTKLSHQALNITLSLFLFTIFK